MTESDLTGRARSDAMRMLQRAASENNVATGAKIAEATLAKWMGADSVGMRTVAPNVDSFDTDDLGLLLSDPAAGDAFRQAASPTTPFTSTTASLSVDGAAEASRCAVRFDLVD